MTHHGQIRWYNPTLEDFEWREVPTTDEQALQLLVGSPYSSTCTQTYREWRGLGASMAAALMRAGEMAKEQSEREQRAGVDAPPRRGEGPAPRRRRRRGTPRRPAPPPRPRPRRAFLTARARASEAT